MDGYVFLSYVSENGSLIDRLRHDLEAQGIKTWCDRFDLLGGDRWLTVIRHVIPRASFFVACFSQEYARRPQKFMDKELEQAAAHMSHLPPLGKRWFIPIKFSPCELPPLDIGHGHRLSHDLHCIDLAPETGWEAGICNLLRVLRDDCLSAPSSAPSSPLDASTGTSHQERNEMNVKIHLLESDKTAFKNTSSNDASTTRDNKMSIEIDTMRAGETNFTNRG